MSKFITVFLTLYNNLSFQQQLFFEILAKDSDEVSVLLDIFYLVYLYFHYNYFVFILVLLIQPCHKKSMNIIFCSFYYCYNVYFISIDTGIIIIINIIKYISYIK